MDALRFCDWGVLNGAEAFCRRQELRVKYRFRISGHLDCIRAADRHAVPDDGTRPHEKTRRLNMLISVLFEPEYAELELYNLSERKDFRHVIYLGIRSYR